MTAPLYYHINCKTPETEAEWAALSARLSADPQWLAHCEAVNRLPIVGPPLKPRKIEIVVIYIVQVGNFVKIGMSRRWRRRVANIQTATPFEVKVLSVEYHEPSHEAHLHRRFKKHHHRGEWFHAHPDILEYAERQMARPGRSPLQTEGGW